MTSAWLIERDGIHLCYAHDGFHCGRWVTFTDPCAWRFKTKAEAELVIAKPEFQDPSMHQQISDIQDHVRLHSDLKAILLEIEATAWGADGSALAALSQKAGALITPDLEARPAVSFPAMAFASVDDF